MREIKRPASYLTGRKMTWCCESLQLGRNRFDILPISVRHADRVARLPFHHRDPFDRLIVAQALEDAMPLLSADQIMDRYGAQRIW